jgi:hypothetical protein
VKAALTRIGGVLGRILQGPDSAEAEIGPEGPTGSLLVPNDGAGRFVIRTVQGRPCLTPDEASYYLYGVLPAELLARARGGAWVEVEYFGERHGPFRVQYASTDRGAEHGGVYKSAVQLWEPDHAGLRRFRRALFPLPDFDPAVTQNFGASFRLEFRSEMLVSRISLSLHEPEDRARFTARAPLPDLKKLPGRFYPINYLFVEITNACNVKCTWCPDDIMDRRRGFMKKEKVFRILDEIAEKRSWLGPLYPVKLHQMGEPMLHPELPAIVEYAESRGVPIELNTNCGLITPENIDALYRAGLTNLILSYQTPDVASFKTRKAPRISFEDYRDKVRLAVERKVALGARTRLEIDIMNTKYADGYRIVSEDEQAAAFIEDWVSFCEELERRHGLTPRGHDADLLQRPGVLCGLAVLRNPFADFQETPLADTDGDGIAGPSHAGHCRVCIPVAVLRPGVALVRNLHLRAQHEHGKALRHGGGEVLGEWQQEAVGRWNHQHGGEQAALGGAPAGERGAIGRQAGDVVGQLRVKKCTRVGPRDREQSVARKARALHRRMRFYALPPC